MKTENWSYKHAYKQRKEEYNNIYKEPKKKLTVPIYSNQGPMKISKLFEKTVAM